MGRNLIEVTFVFENCECVTIQRKHIGTFEVSGISRKIRRTAVNSISEFHTASEVIAQIARGATAADDDMVFDDKSPVGRIRRYPDITSIQLRYEDDARESLTVKWGGDDYHSNRYQSTATHPETGDLFLVISADKTASEFFADEIEDEDSRWWAY